MQHDFWHQRWQENRIGFHQPMPNPLLVEYISKLDLKANARIFIPLSGKTLDISWLLQQGYRVVAIELSQIAATALIEQLATDFNLDFAISAKDALTHYTHANIDIFVGDFFELSQNQLGEVDAIYDRAALVALPTTIRSDYTQHLSHISQHAAQLLLSYEYDQPSYQGPPFSVDADEIWRHYAAVYQIELLQQLELSNHFKGNNAVEKVWYLKPRR